MGKMANIHKYKNREYVQESKNTFLKTRKEGIAKGDMSVITILNLFFELYKCLDLKNEKDPVKQFSGCPSILDLII